MEPRESVSVRVFIRLGYSVFHIKEVTEIDDPIEKSRLYHQLAGPRINKAQAPLSHRGSLPSGEGSPPLERGCTAQAPLWRQRAGWGRRGSRRRPQPLSPPLQPQSRSSW